METPSSPYFSADPTGIAYREVASPLISVGIGIFGLFFLAFTVAFSTEIASWPWHSGKAVGLLSVIVFLSFSLVIGLLAYAGVQPQHVRFNAKTKRVEGRARGKLWLLQTVDESFDTLGQPSIKVIERESDADLYEIRVEAGNQLTFALGSFEQRPEAEYWRNRLDQLLNKDKT